MCPPDAADSFQGEAIVHAILSDHPPLHHRSSSAMLGYSGVLIAVLSGRVSEVVSKVSRFTTCLKRFDGSANALVVTLDPSNTLILGEEQF